jgi:hypothetical protein
LNIEQSLTRKSGREYILRPLDVINAIAKETNPENMMAKTKDKGKSIPFFMSRILGPSALCVQKPWQEPEGMRLKRDGRGVI